MDENGLSTYDTGEAEGCLRPEPISSRLMKGEQNA